MKENLLIKYSTIEAANDFLMKNKAHKIIITPDFKFGVIKNKNLCDNFDYFFDNKYMLPELK